MTKLYFCAKIGIVKVFFTLFGNDFHNCTDFGTETQQKVKIIFIYLKITKGGRVLNRTLLQAQLLYNDMGRSEKRVADWLFSHSGEVLPYSITDLASMCKSSEATIVRFSKRLGCTGYQDLKLTLAKEHEKKVIAPMITSEDDCFAIFEKVCNDAYNRSLMHLLVLQSIIKECVQKVFIKTTSQ